MELKGKKVNFLGDSITQGVGASCEQNKYVEVFARLTGAKVRNYGISGTRIARQHGVNPYGECYCYRIDTMDADADVVVVFGGTNDYGHGDAPIGTPDDKTPDTFYGACNYLACELMKKYPTATIVFLTPLHRVNEDFSASQRPDGPVLKEFVDIIREVAEKYSIPVLDLWKMAGIQPNIEISKITYMPDGLHPNDAGHALLANRLAGFLRSL